MAGNGARSNSPPLATTNQLISQGTELKISLMPNPEALNDNPTSIEGADDGISEKDMQEAEREKERERKKHFLQNGSRAIVDAKPPAAEARLSKSREQKNEITGAANGVDTSFGGGQKLEDSRARSSHRQEQPSTSRDHSLPRSNAGKSVSTKDSHRRGPDSGARSGELVDAEASTSGSSGLQSLTEIPGWQGLIPKPTVQTQSWGAQALDRTGDQREFWDHR